MGTERMDAVDPPALAVLVVDRIRDAIMDGRLPPGSQLVQRDLAQQLGVSREPVKHALRVLEGEGLVEARPRRTSVVAEVSMKATWEIYEARSCLEPFIAAKVARYPDADRERLAARLTELCDEADRTQDGVELAVLDRRFHTLLYEAADSELMLRFLRANWRDIERVMRRTSSTSWVSVSWREHRQIIEAIRRGEVEEVSDCSREHVVRAFEWIAESARADAAGPDAAGPDAAGRDASTGPVT